MKTAHCLFISGAFLCLTGTMMMNPPSAKGTIEQHVIYLDSDMTEQEFVSFDSNKGTLNRVNIDLRADAFITGYAHFDGTIDDPTASVDFGIFGNISVDVGPVTLYTEGSSPNLAKADLGFGSEPVWLLNSVKLTSNLQIDNPDILSEFQNPGLLSALLNEEYEPIIITDGSIGVSVDYIWDPTYVTVQYDFTPAVVPEPSTYLAGLCCLGILGSCIWRKRI